MKKLATATVLTAMGAFAILPLLGAENDPADKPPKARHAHHRLRAAMDELKLSDEQRREVRGIMDTYRQAVANWRKENAPKLQKLGEQYKEALRDNDTETINDIREKRGDILAKRKELTDEMLEILSEVLNGRTDGQGAPDGEGLPSRVGADFCGHEAS